MAQIDSDNHKFSITVALSDREFWRFNLYMACEALNAEGERIDYVHKLDIVAEEPYPQECPSDYKAERVATLDVPECASARVLIYLVPFQLPDAELVADVAPLYIQLQIVEDGKVVASRKIGSNAWSGSRFDVRLPLEGLHTLRQASENCPPV